MRTLIQLIIGNTPLVYTWFTNAGLIYTRLIAQLLPITSLLFVIAPNALADSNLSQQLQKDTGLGAKIVKEQVNEVFMAIEQVLIQEGKVNIRAFGTFYLKPRGAWEIKHPRSGKIIQVPPRLYPRFRSSEALKKRINSTKP